MSNGGYSAGPAVKAVKFSFGIDKGHPRCKDICVIKYRTYASSGGGHTYGVIFYCRQRCLFYCHQRCFFSRKVYECSGRTCVHVLSYCICDYSVGDIFLSVIFVCFLLSFWNSTLLLQQSPVLADACNPSIKGNGNRIHYN